MEDNKAASVAGTDIDTIFALSSARGKAGVAVIRISGPQSFSIYEILTGGMGAPDKKTAYRPIYHPDTKVIIDKAFFVFFTAPKSYTGEHVLEIHCHGSQAILDDLFSILGTMDKVREADPGEFTRRAFENNKMNLTEAEAVADLIDAQTSLQRDQALMQLQGGLTDLYHNWADRLTRIVAHAETVIDFPDEDIPDEEVLTFKPEIEALTNEIRHHLDDKRKGERLREGIKIAVIGAPNAGKSTLVNALAQRDIAIVSDLKGTTRDIIEAHLDIAGYPVIIADTAGLRPSEIFNQDSHDAIEQEGIKRALDYAQNADIKLLVFDGAEETLHENTMALRDENSILVVNKSDRAISENKDMISISAENGQGLDILLVEIEEKLKILFSVSRETPSLTRQRHRTNLENTITYLAQSLNQTLPELLSQELRSALYELGKITGRVDVEDLLDVIFKDFCIGK